MAVATESGDLDIKIPVAGAFVVELRKLLRPGYQLSVAAKAQGVIAVDVGRFMVFAISNVSRERTVAVFAGESFMVAIRQGLKVLLVFGNFFSNPLLIVTVGAGTRLVTTNLQRLQLEFLKGICSEKMLKIPA